MADERETLTETRIEQLETRAAYQDQLIDELNAALTAQWTVIDRLER